MADRRVPRTDAEPLSSALLLSDVLRTRVRAEGRVIGRVADVAVDLTDARPVVEGLVVRRRGTRREEFLPWREVQTLGPGSVEISSNADALASTAPDYLLLRRHVLDTQVVDLAGKRVARVSDIVLSASDGLVRAVAVDIGTMGVWRRLRPFRNGAPGLPDKVVDWADLHLTSEHGHRIQLERGQSEVHRLTATELAGLIVQLPTHAGARVLDSAPQRVAAAALSASHPKAGGRLLQALPPPTATSLVEQMHSDDAAALLRTLPLDGVEALLAGLPSERAATLQRLLSHPAHTAAALMNTDVRTACIDESLDDLRVRARADPRELEGMATFFVVDEAGRPVGTVEPSDLLANRVARRTVPAVPASLPVGRLIDLFALHDFVAVPVVDDEGRLVGAVAVDDVLEELLAERLPGRTRFGGVRRREPRNRRAREAAAR